MDNTKEMRGKLFFAIDTNQVDMVHELLALGPDSNIINEAMIRAAGEKTKKYGTKCLELLVEFGADMEYRTPQGNTALLQALRTANVAAVNFLLDKGVSVDGVTYHGINSPLMMAAVGGNPQIIDRLLQAGCDVNSKNEFGSTALLYALLDSKYNAAKMLIERGAMVDVFNKFGDTPLNCTARYTDTCYLKLLLDYGADANFRNQNGYTALKSAIFSDNLRSLDLLLQAGANPNISDDEGNTSLMYAAKYSTSSVMERLLEAGADMEAKDCNGDTALIYALCNDQKVSTDFLIEKGACVHAVTHNGETPLSVAFNKMDKFSTRFVKFLELRADLCLPKRDQRYLNTMVIEKHNSVVQKLVANGWTPATYPLHTYYDLGPLSLFETALLFNNIGAARYFLVNRFLTHRDITELPHSPRIQSLLVEDCAGENSNDECIQRSKFIETFSASPFSLFSLCFVAVSSALEQDSLSLKDWFAETSLPDLSIIKNQSEIISDTIAARQVDLLQSLTENRSISTPCNRCHITAKSSSRYSRPPHQLSRIEKVRQLPLPQSMKKALLFQTSTASIDPGLWLDIPVDNI